MATMLRALVLGALVVARVAATPRRALQGEADIEVLLMNIKPFDAAYCFRIAPSDGNGNPSSDFVFVEEPLAFGDRAHGVLPPTAGVFVAQVFLFTGGVDAICETSTVGSAAIEAGEWRTAPLGFVSNSVAITFTPNIADSATNVVLVDLTNRDQTSGTNEFKYLNYATGFGDCEFTVSSNGDTDGATNTYTLSDFGASSVLDRECRDVDLTQLSTQLTCESSAQRGSIFQQRNDFCLNGQNIYVAAGIQGSAEFPLQLFSFNAASECQDECLTIAEPDGDEDSEEQTLSDEIWFAVIVAPVIAILLCAVAGCWWCGCFTAPPEEEDEEYEEEFDEEARKHEKSGLVAVNELKESPEES